MHYITRMNWKVIVTNKCEKQINCLSERVLLVLQLLIDDFIEKGPIPGKNWPNYSKLRGKKSEDKRHCHIMKGNPTYVCCWNVDKVNKIIEVYYVGTHEKAPY